MAGGPTVPALVIAAAEAGALAFLAGGYKSPAKMRSEMAAVRAGTDAPFGVNVFVPGQPTREPEALADYLEEIEEAAAAFGVKVGPADWDDDAFDDKVEVLLADPPAVVSFTFGCPPPDVLGALKERSAMVAVTVTTTEEADLAVAAGSDLLCLQGSEAGGHRGTFVIDDRPGQDVELLELLTQIRRRCELPLIAAGGIAGPADVAAAISAGADLCQAGTAFLRCAESGASPTYQRALAERAAHGTAITRAFSGRRARGVGNRFMREHPGAPRAYPEINNATRPIRAAAAAVDDAEHVSLFAGVHFAQARPVPAGEIIEFLVSGLSPNLRGGLR